MRWTLMLVLAYLALVVQNMLGILVRIDTAWLGAIWPDILAVTAVFIVLSVRNVQDVMIACWVLGMGLDLTTVGESGAVGPMALAYCAAGWAMFKFRDAFFRDRFSSQMILSALFAFLAHTIWVTLQFLIAMRSAHWGLYGPMLLKACLLALYTGLAAPIVFVVLKPCGQWIVSSTSGRTSRNR